MNSAASAVSGFAGVIYEAILPPAGVDLCSEKEHLIWKRFTRAKEDWRDIDHIMLATIVKIEVDIRAAQVEMDAVGMMAENKRGTQIPDPLIAVIDILEWWQLAVIRSMFLNRTADDLHTIKGTAKVESEA